MKKWKNKWYRVYWALRYEPLRVFAWMKRHDPFTGKRNGLFEACRAVCENPPVFDLSWDKDME